jgi:hypothetical protein
MTGGKSPDIVKVNQQEALNPTPLKIDLHDSHAIRRELCAVYRDMRGLRLDISDGTKLAYVLDMIRKAYETSVLEGRLEQLERTLKTRNTI